MPNPIEPGGAVPDKAMCEHCSSWDEYSGLPCHVCGAVYPDGGSPCAKCGCVFATAGKTCPGCGEERIT